MGGTNLTISLGQFDCAQHAVFADRSSGGFRASSGFYMIDARSFTYPGEAVSSKVAESHCQRSVTQDRNATATKGRNLHFDVALTGADQ
jgi:hypothetical protein